MDEIGHVFGLPDLSASGNAHVGASGIYVVGGVNSCGNAVSQLTARSDKEPGTTRELESAIPMAGQLLSGVLWVSVWDSAAVMTSEQRARIQDAIATLNGSLHKLGVTLVAVDADENRYADIRLQMATVSACGSAADGVLGCETANREITIVQGWDWYTGADADAVATHQFDFDSDRLRGSEQSDRVYDGRTGGLDDVLVSGAGTSILFSIQRSAPPS